MSIHDPLPAPDEGRPVRNLILRSLAPDEWERVRPHLQRVRLPLREVLIAPHRPAEHVWFVEDGMVSLVSFMDDGATVETATVGYEGMIGVPVFLGGMETAGQAFVQIVGEAYRMPAQALRDEVRRDGTMARLLGRYVQCLFTLVAQGAACNRKHSVDQRCARWLLMTHDRVVGDDFALTQQFLSQMLGVRRATVSEAAADLQARGLIEYTRGKISVLDRAGLESASCVCYSIIRAEFARILGGRDVPSPLDELRATSHLTE